MHAAEIIRQMGKSGATVVLEKETKEILELAGISTTRCHEVNSAEDACRAAQKIGYPVVLKLSSPALLHKSEGNGVILDLETPEELSVAYEQLLARGKEHDPDVKVVLQQMAPPGVELIAGATTDPHFGTVLMLGTGGIFAEIIDDAVFRLPPLDPVDVQEMIDSLRGKILLDGYRGSEKCDLEALQQTLLNLSALVCSSPAIQELDINPLVVYPRGVLALDARLLLKQKGSS